ncbi:hypothetical protein L484_005272 [Morus notabilis]|uniref:Uncharacterized protein n=1 Tax=Morus notabilis TaxID=981085 RepID=W9R0P2_9ROSA|nr:hypothetical protein L484_005272 [Morus notabilis]
MHNRHRSPGNGYRSSASSCFGVAPPPPPPPPPQPRRASSFQPPRKADVFAEAGRLAAEYLVSQGLLPPTVLSSSSSVAAAAAYKRSFLRPPPPPPDSADSLAGAAEGRASALSRLGNPAVRRRFNVDEFRSKGSARRRPFRGYGSSDWGRDYSRTPSFHDRFPRDSPDFDIDSDGDVAGDGNSISEPTPRPAENLPSKNEEEPAMVAAPPAPTPDSDDDSDGEDLNFKQTEGDNPTVEDSAEKQNFDKASSSKMMVVDKNDDHDDDHHYDHDDSSNNTAPDLRTICKFAKVPSTVRYSKTWKTAPKVDPIPIPASEEDKEVLASENSSGMLTVKSAADNVGRVGDVYDLERENCASSSRRERGEKRDLEEGEGDDNGQEERAKRARDWPPSSAASVAMEEGDCFNNISNLSEKQVGSREDSMVDNSQFSKHGDEEHSVEFSQEKQLFPSSFKICDLNLMEVSDAHESRDANPIMIYPPMKREASPIDVDLSISNSTNPAGETSRRPIDAKEIEVIDLENDCAQEEKDMVIEDRKTETVYTDLEGFPNHAQNTGDIPDVQDGYGLMISELLGNDFPNCSSVPENINPLHNDIGLHNGEGALADDDSIYMSLGEIPLSMPSL